MSNAAKAKGTRWETTVLAHLRTVFPRAYKPRQEGFEDIGDIHAGRLVVQAKDWRSWEAAIREGLDGAVRQAATWATSTRSTGTAGEPIGVAVVKRARRPVGEAYAVLRLDDLLRLLGRA